MDNPHLDPRFADRLNMLPDNILLNLIDPHPQGLTILQRFARPIVRWLFYGQVGSGRSYLIAHVIVQRAIETQQSVYLFDHTVALGQAAQRHHIDYILSIISKIVPAYYKRYTASYNRTWNTITVLKSKATK